MSVLNLVEPMTSMEEMSHIADTAVAPISMNQFVCEYGHQSDSYLSTAPGRQTFWSEGQGGLVSYMRIGRHVLVSGGLIAPPSERPRLLREFLQLVRSRRWRANFFCIPEEDVPIFRDIGYAINKLGEDAVIDLREVTFAGSSFEWVRRQSNYCLRHGVTFEELRKDDYSASEWAEIQLELEDVGRDGMRKKPQVGELTFFDGALGKHELGYRRLFVARTEKEGRSRMEGYVVCNPMLNGQSWSTEIYRHRLDAERGTIPFMFHQIALQMKQEGVEKLNLCIALIRNCEEPVPGEKPFVRHALVSFRKHGSALFDLQGIDHFKSRFRPHYENSYLCSPPGISIGAILSTIHALGLLRVSPFKLMRSLWGRVWRKRAKPSTTDTGA